MLQVCRISCIGTFRFCSRNSLVTPVSAANKQDFTQRVVVVNLVFSVRQHSVSRGFEHVPAEKQISKEEGDKPLIPSSTLGWTVVVEQANADLSVALWLC